MRLTSTVVMVGLAMASAPLASAQTSSVTPPAPTDVYHLHINKAAPGEAAALGKALSQPDSSAPMPEHFIVFRHQEGDDWDYAVLRHVGQKATISIPAAAVSGGPDPALSAWHRDSYLAGPSWAELSKQLGVGASAKPGAVYLLGVHRAIPGHRTQLQNTLNQPPAADAKVDTGTAFLWHLEGGEWQFLTITRYNSWQDFAADRAAAADSGAGGWADIRRHSAFHRDTLADRIAPMK